MAYIEWCQNVYKKYFSFAIKETALQTHVDGE